MSMPLLGITLFITLLDWLAVAKKWKLIEYLAKPGVMVSLLAWLWSMGGPQGPLLWFALGVIFSLAGDVFLMLPRDLFIAGLVAFLLAHLAYLIGFNPTLPPLNSVGLILGILVALTALQIYRRVSSGMAARGGAEGLRIAVLVYTIAISLMTLSALLTLVRPEWKPGPALSVSAGALLFLLSDSLLAWDRFVAPLPGSDLKVTITYHLGQVGIILGATLHFL